jgi:peptide/nickel transport system substrate-binding protein
MKGVKAGKFPQQFELKEFERLAGCKLSFKENPDIAKLNSKIRGNPNSIPSVEKRLPEEPLVYAPYISIGKYGGTLDVLSNATEAGTSDFLSVRHVNLVRFSDDLQTIVPNIAKDWKWNSDFTNGLTASLLLQKMLSFGMIILRYPLLLWRSPRIMSL